MVMDFVAMFIQKNFSENYKKSHPQLLWTVCIHKIIHFLTTLMTNDKKLENKNEEINEELEGAQSIM